MKKSGAGVMMVGGTRHTDNEKIYRYIQPHVFFFFLDYFRFLLCRLIYNLLMDNITFVVTCLALVVHWLMDDDGVRWDSLTSYSGLSLSCLLDLISPLC